MRIVGLNLFLLFFSASCQLFAAPAPAPTASPSTQKAPTVMPQASATSVVSPTEAYVYDPVGKRDPFDPGIAPPAPVAQPQPDVPNQQSPTQAGVPVQQEVISNRPLEPLEKFDIQQLRVTAIIWNTRIPKAVIEDPNRGSYIIRVKTRIGNKNGFVAAIREGEVVVVEYVQENGQYTKVFTTMTFSR